MTALPPLPTEAACYMRGCNVTLYNGERLFTTDQMRAYGEACAAAERERAAIVCEDIAERHLRSGRYSSFIADHSTRAGGQVDGAEECAAAIRALKEKP